HRKQLAERTPQDERPQRPREPVQHEQRDQRRDDGEHPEPPPAEVDEPEHGRQQDGTDDDPRPEGAHYLPPKRRSRLAYSLSAARNSASPKSGHGVSTKTSSAYASCQSRKLEIR